MSRIKLGTLAFALVSTAVFAQTGLRTVWTIRETPAGLRPVVSRADVMIAAMQDSFLRGLHDGLSEHGPAGTVSSSHLDATYLTQRLARSHGIAAGFTSDRLRDPLNAPRDWAADIVKTHAGRRARDIDGFAVDLGDRLGVLRPMVLTRECLSCHGPVEQVPPAVRAILAERYPADRAMGFTEGEIRGWFWIEMPIPGRGQ
jgi:hypothetical protein